MADLTRPDGVDADDQGAPGGVRRFASPLTLLLFGAILLAALLGAFGGQPNPAFTGNSAAAALTVELPSRIRNGEFHETRIMVEARRPIADAVIAVTPTLWRDITINSHIPAASEESFKQGRFTFAYGPLAAGDTLVIKLDGQINPPLFAGTRGAIGLRDGERMLVDLPLTMTVLP